MPALKVGEVVRVLSDARKVQALQKRHGGWSSDMEEVKRFFIKFNQLHVTIIYEFATN